MRVICLFFLSLGVSYSFAQESFEVITHYKNGKPREHFFVSDTTTEFKDGPYAAFFPDGTHAKRGAFEHNKKAGIWHYYNRKGNLIERYSYTLNKSIEYTEHTRLGAVLDSIGLDTAFLREIDRVPHFIGGAPEYENWLLQNLKFPVIAKEMNLNGIVVASFLVDRDGIIRNPKIVRGIGAGCDDEVLRVLSIMPRWVPAVKDEKDIETVFMMPFYFNADKFLLY